MFGLFRTKKEVLKDIEVIHIGDEIDEGNQQLDVLGYSNDGKKAYGIYSKDRVHIGLFGVLAHRSITGEKRCLFAKIILGDLTVADVDVHASVNEVLSRLWFYFMHSPCFDDDRTLPA